MLHRLLSLFARAAAGLPIPRPGLLAPGSTPAQLASPVSRPAGATPRPGVLRRSLRANIAEGAAAEVFAACATGAVVTGWALHLGASPAVVGVLGALPVAAQVLHLPAGWLTSRANRRRLAIAAITTARVAWAPMALVPFLDLDAPSALRLLVAITVASSALSVLGNNAWTSWMGDLVPARVRGRFFGARTAWITLAGAASSLGTAAVIDRLGAGDAGRALASLAAAATVAGVGSGLLLSRQVDPGGGVERARPGWRTFLAVARDRRARDFLVYQLAWGAAIAPAACYWSLHVLGTLGLGFSFLALHGLIVAAARIATAGAWGRFVDRFGARSALAACSMGIAAMPVLWTMSSPSAPWPLLLDAVIAGVLWGGHGIASLDWPLAMSPRRERPFYLAGFAAAAGIGFAVSAILATSAVHRAGDAAILPLFLASGAGRLVCGVWALRLHDDRVSAAAHIEATPAAS